MAYIGQNLDRFSNVEKLDAITPATSTGAGPYNLTKGGVAFTPSSADTMVVSIDGVIQYGNFSVSGSTITFNAALADANTCDFIYHMGTGLLSTPVDNSVSTVKIVDDAVTEAKLNLISTSSVPSLEAKGDGSSQDGYIQLNCSQNSHGVKIQSPAHSAGQSYKLILPTSVGTNGQVLATNGNATNQLSWIDAAETKPTITTSSVVIAPSTSQTFTLNGTNFVSIPIVEFIASTGAITRATAVTFTSATALSVTTNLASGNYFVRVENNDGNAVRSTNAILTASTSPTWTTSAGSLGTYAGNTSGTLATVAATSDSAITYSVTSGQSDLTSAGVTLNTSTGALTTSDFGGSSTTPTTYSFTITATDAEGQTAARAFSLTSSFGATGGGQFN